MWTSTINGVMWMMMAIRDDGYDIGCTNVVWMISNVYIGSIKTKQNL
jgi:hypothetical protein